MGGAVDICRDCGDFGTGAGAHGSEVALLHRFEKKRLRDRACRVDADLGERRRSRRRRFVDGAGQFWFFTEFCGWAVKDMEKGRDGNL